ASASHVFTADCFAPMLQPNPQWPQIFPCSQPITLRGIGAQCQPSDCRPRCKICSRADTRLCSKFTESRAHTASRLLVYSCDANHGTPALAHSARTSSGVRNDVQKLTTV